MPVCEFCFAGGGAFAQVNCVLVKLLDRCPLGVQGCLVGCPCEFGLKRCAAGLHIVEPGPRALHGPVGRPISVAASSEFALQRGERGPSGREVGRDLALGNPGDRDQADRALLADHEGGAQRDRGVFAFGLADRLLRGCDRVFRLLNGLTRRAGIGLGSFQSYGER